MYGCSVGAAAWRGGLEIDYRSWSWSWIDYRSFGISACDQLCLQKWAGLLFFKSLVSRRTQ
eukprot:COSAG01_NODE_3774_length_5710_cov_18.325610_4_plen_61_part_00